MPKTEPLSGCLPSAGQMLLLQAALDRGAEAAAAWERWRDEFGLDSLDEGSYRLLPLIYRNLAAEGLTGSDWSRLKGIHRLAWSQNQVLFHQVRPQIEALQAEGIPARLLKGAALVARYYPDASCRPMRDVDILIPASEAPSLLAKLEARGWRALCWRPGSLPDSFFRFRHAMDFELPGGGRVDLHWHALNLCCHSSADEIFWANPESVDFCGLTVPTCQPTEHLLHACAHGIVWAPVAPVRWIVDALLLLREPSAIEWERLIRTARMLEIVPYVLHPLEFLKRFLDAPIPPEALSELRRTRTRRSVTAEFARQCAPFAQRTAVADLQSFYARWRRSLGGNSPVLAVGGFLRHLQYAFELESLWAIPRQFRRSAWKRLFAKEINRSGI